MAGLNVAARPGTITIAAGATETVLRIKAPANHRLRILQAKISFEGIDSTAEPIKVQLLRQTTDGTGTSTTLVKLDDSIAETIQTTAAHDFSSEPTAGDILDEDFVHGQTGIVFTPPERDFYMVGGGDRFAIRVITPAGVNPDCTPVIHFEE